MEITQHLVWELLQKNEIVQFVNENLPLKKEVDVFARPLISRFNDEMRELAEKMNTREDSLRKGETFRTDVPVYKNIFPSDMWDDEYVGKIWASLEPKVEGAD